MSMPNQPPGFVAYGVVEVLVYVTAMRNIVKLISEGLRRPRPRE